MLNKVDERPKRRNNRLAADEEFLAGLAADLQGARGSMARKVRAHAMDMVDYLEKRDNFWRQIDN